MIKLICRINAVTVSVAFFLVLAFVVFVLLSPLLAQNLPREFIATPEAIVFSITGIVFFTLFVGGFAAILRCVQLLEIMEKRTRVIEQGSNSSGSYGDDGQRSPEKQSARSEPQFNKR